MVCFDRNVVSEEVSNVSENELFQRGCLRECAYLSFCEDMDTGFTTGDMEDETYSREELDAGEERLRQENLPKFYHLQQICIITLGIYGVMCKILNNRRRGTVNHFFINHH